MQDKGNVKHYKEKIQNPKWRKYLPKIVLTGFGMSECLVLVLVFWRTFLDEVEPQVTNIQPKHKGEELHPFPPLPTALPFSLCLQSQPSTHCAPSKIQNGFIYISLSFTLLDVFLATRKVKKERRAPSCRCCLYLLTSGKFPNAAMSHFPMDPATMPLDAKKVLKSPCHT